MASIWRWLRPARPVGPIGSLGGRGGTPLANGGRNLSAIVEIYTIIINSNQFESIFSLLLLLLLLFSLLSFFSISLSILLISISNIFL